MDDIHGLAIHSSRTISFHVRILAYKIVWALCLMRLDHSHYLRRYATTDSTFHSIEKTM